MHLPARLQSFAVRLGPLAWLALAGLLGYVAFLWAHTSLQPGGADSSGYFNMARALTHRQLSVPVRTIEGLPASALPHFAYQPLGFRIDLAEETLTPTYPLGLPLLLAVSTATLGEEHGPRTLMVVHAIAALLLTGAIARQLGAGPRAAVLAAMLLAASPLFLQFSVQAMSDMPAMVWCAAALWLAGRRTTASAAAAGVAVGLAVLIRPTNLLVLPVVLLLARLDWRSWLALGAGGAPAAAVLLWFNHAAYGSSLATGYGEVGALFSTEWVPRTLRHYALWMPVCFSPLLLALTAAGWTEVPFRRARLAHGLFALLMLGLYSAYYHTHETWWYLRFVLPIGPSLLALSCLGGERLLARRPASWRWRLAAAGVVALAFAPAWHWNERYKPYLVGRDERIYLDAVRFARGSVPPGAVILTMQASGALFHGADQIIVRWDNLDDAWPKVRAAAEAAGRPIYAILFDFEVREAFAGPTPGNWHQLAGIRHLSLWRLDPPAP